MPLAPASPNVLWADLGQFDLTPGAPAMLLDPDEIELSGNVSTSFRRAEHDPFSEAFAA